VFVCEQSLKQQDASYPMYHISPEIIVRKSFVLLSSSHYIAEGLQKEKKMQSFHQHLKAVDL
jgi:hypothetical protein